MFQGYGVPKLRRAIVRRLAEAYSRDDLTLEDYECRVEAAEQAKTIDDLEAIVDAFPDNSPDSLHKSAPSGPNSLHPAIWLVPATLLAIAPLPLPYGYYVLLRLVVCAATALLTYHDYRGRGRVSGWTIALAATALLFNPVISVGLTREIWTPIDISAALLILGHFWRRRR